MSDFTWSYSSLKEYINCAKKYQEVRVLKNYTFQDTVATIYGKEVHKALEDYVKSNTELAKNYERYKGLVDNLIAIPGEKYCELEMALTKEKTPCEFEDPNRWVRGIADLVIVDGDTAFIVDYKTGSNKYPDPKQLKLMALMIFAHFSQVNYVKAGLLFLAHNHFIPEEYKREDTNKLWEHFLAPLTRLEHSYKSNTWQANPTPLCKYCPVKTCDFNNS